MIRPYRALVACLALSACRPGIDAPRRDWTSHPVFAVVPPSPAPLWAVSDIHGGFDRLVLLLQGNEIIDAGNHWTGGDGTLVVVGDLIDKGTGGLATIDLLMALESEASAAGGQVIVSIGNHEAEFLADPWTSKGRPFRAELDARGIDPADVARGKPPYGSWLRNLPFGVRSGDWFFVHGGATSGLSLDALAQKIRSGVDADGFGADAVIGGDSVLEAQRWWEPPWWDASDPRLTVDRNLAALGMAHLVFGHDPSAFANPDQITAHFSGALIRIDVGMSPAINLSIGAVMLLDRSTGKSVASALSPDGTSRELYRDP